MTPWKLVGALLVIAASSGAGLTLAAAYARRPRSLAAWRAAADLLQTEVVYGAAPLPEALARAAAHAPDPVAGALLQVRAGLVRSQGEPVSELWAAAVWDHAAAMGLTADDGQALADLGGALGRSDRQDQARHFAATDRRLAALEVAAREDAARMGRLWRYAGPLTGLLVTVLLL